MENIETKENVAVNCGACGVGLTTDNVGLSDEYCQECWQAHCAESWWGMFAAATPETQVGGFDYVIGALRSEPKRIATLQTQLDQVGYELAALDRQIKSFEMSAQFGAMQDKANKNEAARKIAAAALLDADTAYPEALERRQAALERRDAAAVAIRYSKDLLKSVIAEANLLGLKLGAQ